MRSRRRHAHGRIRIDHDGAVPANGRLPRSRQPPGGTTDDRQPPQHAPITQTAKPVAVRRRIWLRTCLTGRAPDSSMSRPLFASSGSGCQQGQERAWARSGPARRENGDSHPNCAGCTTSRPAGSAACRLNHPSPPIAGGRTTPPGRLVSSARPGSAMRPFPPQVAPAPSASPPGCAAPVGTP